MNDSRLTILTQMAREVEELELAAAEPVKLSPVARAPGSRHVLATLGPLAALAACIAIADANSAEVILEATAPWATFLNFTVRPIVPTDKSPAILERAITWRDSVR